MTVSAQASQLSNTSVQVSWTTDDTPPVAGWSLSRDDDGGGAAVIATILSPDARSFIDLEAPAQGVSVVYRVVDVTSALFADTAALVIADLDVDFTYGEVDYLATVARYTSVLAVKERLAIEATDVSRDADILSAIIASELALDVFMHRSFPDTGTNPQIPGIPDSIKQAALQTAIATWKEADAPTGSSGSDSFMGALSVSETTRTMIQQSAVLIGFRVGWGVA